MALRVIEMAEGRGEEPKIAVDRADTSLRMPDRMPPGERGKLLVEVPRPLDVAEQGTCLAREAHPEEPLVVAVEGAEFVAGKFVEDGTSLIRAAQVEKEACERGSMKRIPRKVLGRRADRRFLLAEATLLAAQEEPMHARR